MFIRVTTARSKNDINIEPILHLFIWKILCSNRISMDRLKYFFEGVKLRNVQTNM